ncbi:MAG TPA: glycosyltransferase [Bacteroidia bacterium]|nr:glycosyltransferase [Bacteroidia bacterium]
MKLSVIIVNYNVKYFLEQCLHSVLKASAGIPTELWVVDNNSVDGSIEMLKEKFPSVHVIANRDNKGFSKANNQAILQSTGDYVLLLNPDTVVEEDTFRKILDFMDAHPDAGGLGVKMIDGTGRFLPESKRGLPTPLVAFYKIFGLSALFPKSKTFGRYHLGYLDQNAINAVDVLAGAFMLIRKTVLGKTGLLDEDFFMYGEDIDLSYRIIKAWYKNYYFPDTRIIHYKGESTKKSSVNYVFVFYNAMIIFAKKHFSKSNASLFTFFIRFAIYLRAGAALFIRFLKKMFLPLVDFCLLYAGMYFLKEYWGRNLAVHYPPEFMKFAVPGYLVVWITSVFFSGGYDSPIRLSKVIRGVFTGTLLILVIYALLPEEFRFSRALILLGAVWASIAMAGARLLLNAVFSNKIVMENAARKRLLIVGEEDEGIRVLSLLKLSDTSHNFIGFVKPSGNAPQLPMTRNKNQTEYANYYLGADDKLGEILEVYSIDEVIFCGKDVPSNQIINCMATEQVRDVEFKIAPPESMFIIGSSSVDNPGELYVIDINSISKAINQRNKRVIDILLAIVFLIVSPVLIFLQHKPSGLYPNIFSVLGGAKSWVGYSSAGPSADNLPRIRSGILNPIDGLNQHSLDALTISRLNSLYAKDYKAYADLRIVFKGLRNLGRRTVLNGH